MGTLQRNDPGDNKARHEPKRTVENGVWLLDEDEIGRNKDPVFDLRQLRLGENNNRAWVINTKHGAVLMETWKRSADSPTYIEYQIWIDEYRYWQRKKDEYLDDSERIKSAQDFAQLVLQKTTKFNQIK